MIEFRWLKHGEPMPNGWHISPNAARCIHHRFAILIYREVLV